MTDRPTPRERLERAFLTVRKCPDYDEGGACVDCIEIAIRMAIKDADDARAAELRAGGGK